MCTTIPRKNRDQSVGSIEFPLGAYSTGKNKRGGACAWVLLASNDEEQTEGTVERGGHNSQLGDFQAGI